MSERLKRIGDMGGLPHFELAGLAGWSDVADAAQVAFGPGVYVPPNSLAGREFPLVGYISSASGTWAVTRRAER